MSHIPSISFREALSLGASGTMGRSDPACPDNFLTPLRTPGTIDICCAADASGSQLLWIGPAPETVRSLYLKQLAPAGQCLVSQGYRLPTVGARPERITQKDFEAAAKAIGCEVAAIKAVAEVEARGSGFFGDGRPKILFEAHHFSRLTKRIYDKLFPHISSSRWKRSLYLGGAREYQRLEEAIELDSHAAIQSASWGAFQVMGFNYAAAGFNSPEDMVVAMYSSEGAHLHAFVGFILKNGLSKYIREKNWAAFAAAYNGPSYAENKYDSKMAAAYAKHAAPPKPPGGGASPGSKGPSARPPGAGKLP